jgi:hypothetical protein
MKQANIQAGAPGFFGLNTERSPVALGPEWAAIADNVIIDASGRVGSRKGFRLLTADNTDLGSAKITNIHEANYTDGTSLYFATGNNKFFTFNKATGALTEITAGAPSGDDWQIATLNDDTFFFQRGEVPRVYDKSTSTFSLITAHTDYDGTAPNADCVVAAYGRLWAGGVDGERSILYWSDLRIGADWFGSAAPGSTAGALDLTNLWPTGNDQIKAIAAHNNKLIVFGDQNVLVFGSSAADGRLGDPANDLFIEDTIVDIGILGKYAWAVVGSDLWFIDYSGLRSLGRTIQEKSLPIGLLSVNVDTQFRSNARTAGTDARLFYSPDEAFVLAIFETQPITWVFDTRQFTEGGGARVTTWSNLDFQCASRAADGTVWFGNNDGINEYGGFADKSSALGIGGDSYRFRYYTHPQLFGEPAKLKIPKEVDFTIAGGLGQQAVAYWGFSYAYLFHRQPFVLNSVTPDFYNNGPNDQYNWTPADPDYDTNTDDITEYGSGNTIGEYDIPLSGSGRAVVIGLEADVLGQQLSLQEINLQTKIGRTI